DLAEPIEVIAGDRPVRFRISCTAGLTVLAGTGAGDPTSRLLSQANAALQHAKRFQRGGLMCLASGTAAAAAPPRLNKSHPSKIEGETLARQDSDPRPQPGDLLRQVMPEGDWYSVASFLRIAADKYDGLEKQCLDDYEALAA